MTTEAVLVLLLGWALGLLSGPLAEHIRRGHRRKELEPALKEELRRFRHLMANLVFILRSKVGDVDHDLIDFVLPIFQDTDIDRPPDEVMANLLRLRDLSEEDLMRQSSNKVADGRGLTLKSNTLPMLDAAVPELTLLPPRIRGRLLDVKERVALWNQEVPYLMDMHRRTFDSSLTPGNRAIVQENLASGYRRLAGWGREIVERIGVLLEEW